MLKVKCLFKLRLDCCKVSLNFSGKFYIVMHTVSKEAEMRVFSSQTRLFYVEGCL